MTARILVLILLVVLLLGVGYVLVKRQGARDAAAPAVASQRTYPSLAVMDNSGDRTSVGIVRALSSDSLVLAEVVNGREELTSYLLATDTRIVGEVKTGTAVVVVSREAEGRRRAAIVYAHFDEGVRIVHPVAPVQKRARPAEARPQGPGGPEPGGPRGRPDPQ